MDYRSKLSFSMGKKIVKNYNNFSALAQTCRSIKTMEISSDFVEEGKLVDNGKTVQVSCETSLYGLICLGQKGLFFNRYKTIACLKHSTFL